MDNQPTLLNRVVARIKGEVSTETLEAYRRAGSTVYDLLEAAEKSHAEARATGQNAWTIPPARQAQLLFTWNAFVLQTLGDQFLDADYAADPLTVGFVPPITAEQCQLFYDQVAGWLGQARQAECDPEYKVNQPLPAPLPGWREADPCPMAHLAAMVAALGSIRRHAEGQMAVFEGYGAPADKAKELGRIRQLMAESISKSEYAERLMSGRVNAELHEQIERQAQVAIEGFYRLGQLIAMPALALQEEAPKPKPAEIAPLPAQSDMPTDPWVMTDPSALAELKRNPEAVKAIDNMWRHDPDRATTLRIQAQIQVLKTRGEIDYARSPNGRRVGHYMCTPWAPIFVAKSRIEVAGETIGRGMEFTFEISAEGVNVGEEFRREIVKGPFRTAPEIDYCDPNVKGPHDD